MSIVCIERVAGGARDDLLFSTAFHSAQPAFCDEQPLLRIWEVQDWEHAPSIFQPVRHDSDIARIEIRALHRKRRKMPSSCAAKRLFVQWSLAPIPEKTILHGSKNTVLALWGCVLWLIGSVFPKHALNSFFKIRHFTGYFRPLQLSFAGCGGFESQHPARQSWYSRLRRCW